MVELLFLYCNTQSASKKLLTVRFVALSQRRSPEKGTSTRQVQRRLSEIDARELTVAYQQGAGVKELAKRFGIHRETVSQVLKRAGVARRTVGLSAPDVTAAAALYREGWSVARLGAKFDVDGTTVWRMLVREGVVMRTAQERPKPR